MTASFLRQVPLLAGLPESALQELAAATVPRRFGRGQVIILTDQQGDDFFLIRAGQVKVFLARADGREIILSFLGPGAVFGELSLLDGRPRSATVTATEDTELITLQRPLFLALLHRHPQIATALLAELASRLRRTDHQIGYLALCSVAHRVTKAVLQLALEQGQQTDEGLLLAHRPTHEDLARMAGTTRETVTRVLGRLEREGYLVSRGRQLLVLDELQERTEAG